MMNLKEMFQLSDRGASDLKKGIFACTLTNLSLMLSVVVTVQIFLEILKPLTDEEVSWNKMWMLFGTGVIAVVLHFFCCKNDYRKTYMSCYTAAEDSRIRIAEMVRKFPMSVFNDKDLTELTTNMMGDCASIEHSLSHIVPPLMANAISCTLICICVMVFDWRIELLFHSSTLSRDAPELLKILGVNGRQVQNRFCQDAQSYFTRADEQIKRLFEDMGNAPQKCRVPYLQMKVAELLLLLCLSDMPEKSDDRSFMTMGQVQIAKQVMEIISADLSRHYSIENLAAPFGVSPSSLKNYFQGVYGKNISTWLREARMSAASTALREGNQPVAEIAASVGYENASKFSAAFKSFLGETPLEYRRQSRCGI